MLATLRARLGSAAASPETTMRGAGPFDVRVEPIARGRVLLVGDASGYLDAITGEGLSLAFASAAALVEATAGEDASAYPRAWARVRRQHVALTRLVLWVADHPSLRRRVIRAFCRSPDAFRSSIRSKDRPRWPARSRLSSFPTDGSSFPVPEAR